VRVDLKFSGALDATTVPALWAAHSSQGACKDGCVIDLAHVERIDSAGLAFVTALSRTLGGAQLINVPAKARVLARAYDVEALLGDS
jgi:ABC-type transporter Mla MlaB component